MNPLFEPAVALVFASADEAEATGLAAFLRKGMRVNVTPVEVGAETLVEAFERALCCDSVAVLLTPRAVVRRGAGDQWERAMAEAAELGVAVAAVPVEDCVPPGVLRRCPQLRSRRAVKRWLLKAEAPPQAPDPEMEPLLAKAADQPGRIVLPAGSPLLARFVELSRADFEEVVELDCAGRTPENLIAEICLALGASPDGLLEANAERAAGLLASRRVLLALSGLDSASLVKPLVGPLCSLVTTPFDGEPPAPDVVAADLRRNRPAALQWAETAFFAADWELGREIGLLALRLTARERRTAEALRWADCLLGEASARLDRDLAIEAAREKAWLLESKHEDAEFLPIPETSGGEQLSLFG